MAPLVPSAIKSMVSKLRYDYSSNIIPKTSDPIFPTDRKDLCVVVKEQKSCPPFGEPSAESGIYCVYLTVDGYIHCDLASSFPCKTVSICEVAVDQQEVHITLLHNNTPSRELERCTVTHTLDGTPSDFHQVAAVPQTVKSYFAQCEDLSIELRCSKEIIDVFSSNAEYQARIASEKTSIIPAFWKDYEFQNPATVAEFLALFRSGWRPFLEDLVQSTVLPVPNYCVIAGSYEKSERAPFALSLRDGRYQLGTLNYFPTWYKCYIVKTLR